MTNTPLVSCIILLYNGEKFLPQLALCLANQDYPHLEVIVVDNCSSDEGAAWVRKEQSSWRLLLQKENLGFAQGQNVGISAAHGDYVLCLNQDAVLATNYISSIVNIMQIDPQIGSAQGACMQWDGAKDPLTSEQKINRIDTLGLKVYRSGKAANIGEGTVWQLPGNAKKIFGVAGTVPIYRTAALRQCAYTDHGAPEYFNGSFFFLKEDVELAWRLQLHGWQSLFVPQAMAWHLRSARSRSRVVALLGRGLPRQQIIWSILNQQRLLLACVRTRDAWLDLPWLVIREIGYLLIAISQAAALQIMRTLWHERALLRQRRALLQRQATRRSIRSWFSVSFEDYA